MPEFCYFESEIYGRDAYGRFNREDNRRIGKASLVTLIHEGTSILCLV